MITTITSLTRTPALEVVSLSSSTSSLAKSMSLYWALHCHHQLSVNSSYTLPFKASLPPQLMKDRINHLAGRTPLGCKVHDCSASRSLLKYPAATAHIASHALYNHRSNSTNRCNLRVRIVGSNDRHTTMHARGQRAAVAQRVSTRPIDQ